MDKLILLNGLMLADPDTGEILPHDSTVIADGKLVEVNTRREQTPERGEVIDCSGCLIMPGLINSHVHAAMSLFRGLADDIHIPVGTQACGT